MVFRIDTYSLQEIWPIGEFLSIQRFGSGHINDTYLVHTADGNRYILQRVNPKVFDTEALVHNYEVLVPALKDYSATLSPVIWANSIRGKFHYLDKEKVAWRLVDFQEEVKPNQDEVEERRRTALVIGRFQRFLNQLQPEHFQPTIPHFHQLEVHLSGFQETLQKASTEKKEKAQKAIDHALARPFFSKEIELGLARLPIRLTHNDAKRENVLLTASGGMVIDLDTVMPGRLFHDFGDLVRSMVFSGGESEADLSKVQIQDHWFKAVISGYLEGLEGAADLLEIERLIDGSLYIIFEQAIRFLSDYLAGDIYYPVHYPNQNLDRSHNQFWLLELLYEKREGYQQMLRAVL